MCIFGFVCGRWFGPVPTSSPRDTDSEQVDCPGIVPIRTQALCIISNASMLAPCYSSGYPLGLVTCLRD
eukprot:scaffold9028_cov66-Skeletonema_marinoi.AAC.1